jgi:hypothetical protein
MIPDPCGVRKLPTFRQYLAHIEHCSKPECRERRDNHIALAARFGVEWPERERKTREQSRSF